MRITESQLRKIVRRLLAEDSVPENAPPEKQLHVFDFDDTLGVTQDSNGVMLYRDGKPAWSSAKEAEDWVKSAGIGKDEFLKGPKGSTFEKPDGVDGFAAYLSSGVLPVIKSAVAGNVMFVPDKPDVDKSGEVAVIDFSPSATVNSPKPIKPSIDKVKDLDAKGAKTAIVTARAAENVADALPDFAGKQHKVDVQKNLKNFTDKVGAQMNSGVYGTRGGNKGDFIKNTLLPTGDYDEVHFYDDDPSNINKVAGALGGKIDAEVYLYGPGKFQDSPGNPRKPKQSFPPKEEKKESKVANDDLMLERWCKLAGIIEE